MADFVLNRIFKSPIDLNFNGSRLQREVRVAGGVVAHVLQRDPVVVRPDPALPQQVPHLLHLPEGPHQVTVGQLGQVSIGPLELGVLYQGGEHLGILGDVLQAWKV